MRDYGLSSMNFDSTSKKNMLDGGTTKTGWWYNLVKMDLSPSVDDVMTDMRNQIYVIQKSGKYLPNIIISSNV